MRKIYGLNSTCLKRGKADNQKSYLTSQKVKKKKERQRDEQSKRKEIKIRSEVNEIKQTHKRINKPKVGSLNILMKLTKNSSKSMLSSFEVLR